jgi:hypothetical protein
MNPNIIIAGTGIAVSLYNIFKKTYKVIDGKVYKFDYVNKIVHVTDNNCISLLYYVLVIMYPYCTYIKGKEIVFMIGSSSILVMSCILSYFLYLKEKRVHKRSVITCLVNGLLFGLASYSTYNFLFE